MLAMNRPQPQLCLCKNGLRFSRKKAGSVYDLIAKIWAGNDPVYDLPAIDTLFEKCTLVDKERSLRGLGQGTFCHGH